MSNNTPSVPPTVADTKTFRRDLDGILQRLKRHTGVRPPEQGAELKVRASRERSLAITKIEEAIMWLGMDLKAQNEEGVLGTDNPYPSSKDPSSPVIEETADGLTL